MAGVSEGTVDRIIHNRGQVSKTNVLKVNKIIAEFGYKKNIFASNLAFNKKFHFAVVIPESSQVEYWNLPLRGIQKAANEFARFGVAVDYYLHQYNEHSFKKVAKEVFQKQYDGVLIAPVFQEESQKFLQKCISKNWKTIMIDSTITVDTTVAYTGQNAFQSGRIAARLSSLNFNRGTKILVIKITRDTESTSLYLDRIKGFYSFFEENRAFNTIDLEEIHTNESENNLLQSKLFTGVSAVFVPHSRAYIVAEFLEKNQLKDVIVVGYDLLEKNQQFMKKGYIDFLINQKPDLQGFLGIEYLYKSVVLKENPETLNFVPVEIIVKESL